MNLPLYSITDQGNTMSQIFNGKNNSSDILENLLKNDFGIVAKIVNSETKLERQVTINYKCFNLTESFCASFDNDAVISVLAYRIEQKYPKSSKVEIMRKYLKQNMV